MSLELRVPSVGESISEVQIGDWLKKEGQTFRKDEVLVTIESEKATVELPAPRDGVLARILKKGGETARVNEVIAHLMEPGSAVQAEAPVASAAPRASDSAISGSTASAIPILMPAAQRVLAEASLDPAKVTGTGPGGRVTKEDALKAVAASGKVPATPVTPAGASPAETAVATAAGEPPPAANAAPGPATAAARPSSPSGERSEEAIPLSPLRRTVARRLVEAKNSMAMLTTFNEVDLSTVIELRKQYQEAFTARHAVKLGFMSFFVKAVIEALEQTPQLNAELRENQAIYRYYYDIGVAIGGGKGLVVPVIRNAERLSFAEIEKAIADFGARAREGRLKPDELQGGTFTITNGGIYGSLLSTPIINPPQSGILGMHAIQDRPVVVGGQIVIRPMMYLALTYDHRIVDGREAVTFLKRIKEIIETPARLLLEA